LKDYPGRLLVVDDFAYDRDYLTQTLESKGHEVLVAETGEDALGILEKEYVDLVLLDSRLPGLDGNEILAAIRDKRSPLGLPVIMVTGVGETESVVESLKLGANDYLTKPVDVEILAARVGAQLSIKRLRSELIAEREFSDSLIESAAEMIIATDMNRKITLFNRASEEHWGFSRDEVLGLDVDMLYANAKRSARVHEIVLTKGSYRGEMECRRKDGETFMSRMTASVQKDKNGKPIGIIGMMLDLTELRRLEREKEQLVRNKEQFMAMASHDLKNPLTSIEGFAKLLNQYYPPGTVINEQGRECVQTILDNVTRMEKIIQDFLDFHSMEEGRLWLVKEPTDLVELCAEVVKANKEYAHGKQIDLVLETDENLPRVNVDPHRLERVVRNLVSNSIKFCPLNSRVVVTVKKDGGRVRVCVCDNGPGLSKQDLARAFRAKGQLSAKPTGGEKSSGMGLPICKQLVELHEGEIGVHNNPDTGATFWFCVPVPVTE
jgi:PAS domain S-box-containing protein